MKTYKKLVRDKVVDRIRASGAQPVHHVADEAEYKDKLGFKLLEEISEFATARNPDELIDVIEVVNAVESCGRHARPSAEAIGEWVSANATEEDGDPLLDCVYALNDAATEYVVKPSDASFRELVIQLEKTILVTGFERETLELMRRKKLETHGGFDGRVILDEA
jgi:predicted house-cleaning noncanonical NTP pyrophosphatase (MazG superfamily)